MSTQTDRGWVARILGVAAGDLPLEGTIGSFDGATAWLNSAPLTPASLRGHVVVVQFWTYTCINWLRTQAYFRAWGQRYLDHGLITIGVHTPEFKFEHDLDNVRWAVEARKIDYPVAIDNDVAVPRQWRRSLLLHVWLIDSESARKPMTSAPCTTRLRRAGAVRVVLHVVIRRKKASNLDAATGCVRTFEQKSIVSAFSGRNSSEFGTVRPGFKSRAPDQFLNSEWSFPA